MRMTVSSWISIQSIDARSLVGFFISYNSSALQPNVTESVGQLLKLHPEADLYVIGHSMGAAMAHVCILDMKFKYQLPKERLFLYTFGSPRIGNDIFAKFLRDQVQVDHSSFCLLPLYLAILLADPAHEHIRHLRFHNRAKHSRVLLELDADFPTQVNL